MARYNVTHFTIIFAIKNIIYKIIPKKIFNSPCIKLLRSWIFQGALFMGMGELLFKTVVELCLFVGVYNFFAYIKLSDSFIIAFIISHSLLWLCASHFWALEISEGQRLVKNTPVRIRLYLESLERRVNKSKHIDGCILFGSLARGEFTYFSDLDIVFTPAHFMLSPFVTYFLAFRERIISFFFRIPIELYAYHNDFLNAVEESERPLILKDGSLTFVKSIANFYTLSNFPFESQSFFVMSDNR